MGPNYLLSIRVSKLQDSLPFWGKEQVSHS